MCTCARICLCAIELNYVTILECMQTMVKSNLTHVCAVYESQGNTTDVAAGSGLNGLLFDNNNSPLLGVSEIKRNNVTLQPSPMYWRGICAVF
jgi:hypothetical protein